MTELTLFAAHDSTTPLWSTDDLVDIAQHIAGLGAAFLRFDLVEGADDAPGAVLDRHAVLIGRLKRIGGYRCADVASLTPDAPNAEYLRRIFAEEHTHEDDEVRLFVRGSGTFYIHADEQVFRLACTAGDGLCVPAGARHWFDAGEAPDFTAIRLFSNPTGWAATPTGDPIGHCFVGLA